VWYYSEGTATGGSHIDDPERFTFACADAAIGKCVDWGYQPWRSAERCEDGECWSVAGQDYLDTCTRLVRADYCGDGTSETTDGQSINVYDDVGIEDRATTGAWAFEAAWDPNGATCLTKKGKLRHDPLPQCARELREKQCGDGWDAESLIKTDLPATKKIFKDHDR
jgi:hypothetical protein